jgi:hypothetical protein
MPPMMSSAMASAQNRMRVRAFEVLASTTPAEREGRSCQLVAPFGEGAVLAAGSGAARAADVVQMVY